MGLGHSTALPCCATAAVLTQHPVHTRQQAAAVCGCVWRCRSWVDQVDERGHRTTGPLAPVASYEPYAEVHVAVEAVTCVDKGAGTDADVYVRAHTAPALGDSAVSDWARLPAAVEALERGHTDTFDIMLSGIAGRLQKLDVRALFRCALYVYLEVVYGQLPCHNSSTVSPCRAAGFDRPLRSVPHT